MPLFASPSPHSNEGGNTVGQGKPGTLSHHRDSSSSGTTTTRSGSFLSRFHGSSFSFADDPTIKAARHKVTEAEHAEREVDKALGVARRAVREARQHVKSLELAAMEEARRAHAKQQQAKTIRKGADRLGRHNHT